MHPRESRYGRREFLGRSAAGVVGLSSLSTMLAACGGADNGSFKPPALELATPDNPVTQPALRRQPDDRVRPRAGERHAPHLQLERLPLAEDQERTSRKEYGVKVEETFFDTMDEAIAEDLVRRVRLRRLLPDGRIA